MLDHPFQPAQAVFALLVCPFTFLVTTVGVVGGYRQIVGYLELCGKRLPPAFHWAAAPFLVFIAGCMLMVPLVYANSVRLASKDAASPASSQNIKVSTQRSATPKTRRLKGKLKPQAEIGYQGESIKIPAKTAPCPPSDLEVASTVCSKGAINSDIHANVIANRSAGLPGEADQSDVYKRFAIAPTHP